MFVVVDIYPIYYKYDETEPPVTVIIPYKQGEPFNPIYLCKNDQVLVITTGETIGHARILGAKKALNEWLVFMDGDAIYPEDYIIQVKKYIREYNYPILATTRRGGYGDIFFNVHEHGLIVRKDVFLERTKNYPHGVRPAGRRTDIADYFRDAKKIPVKYYHGYTKGEKAYTRAVSLVLLAKMIGG